MTDPYGTIETRDGGFYVLRYERASATRSRRSGRRSPTPAASRSGGRAPRSS